MASSRLVAGFNWRQMSSPVIARKHAAAASGACGGYSSAVRMAVAVAVLLLVLIFLLTPSTDDRAAQPRQLSTRRCPQQQAPAAAGNRSAAASTGSTTIAGEQVAWQRPALLLLGDSLTEFGSQEGGWGAKLAAAYSRKVRVWKCASRSGRFGVVHFVCSFRGRQGDQSLCHHPRCLGWVLRRPGFDNPHP